MLSIKNPCIAWLNKSVANSLTPDGIMSSASRSWRRYLNLKLQTHHCGVQFFFRLNSHSRLLIFHHQLYAFVVDRIKQTPWAPPMQRYPKWWNWRLWFPHIEVVFQ